MVSIKENEFFDYMKCPVIYDFKHNRNVLLGISQNLQSILNTLCNYFFINILDNKLLTLEALKSKYDSLCKENNIDMKKNIEGMKLLYAFYNWACENRISVISPATSYSITYNENNISGLLNPIAINSNKELYFLVVDFSSRIPSQKYYDMKIKYALDLMAYNSYHVKNPINFIKIHHVKSNKDYITSRTTEDLKRVKNTIAGVGTSISNNLYYCRESVFCNSCEYENLCKYWNI